MVFMNHVTYIMVHMDLIPHKTGLPDPNRIVDNFILLTFLRIGVFAVRCSGKAYFS